MELRELIGHAYEEAERAKFTGRQSVYALLPYSEHKRIESLPVIAWWDVSSQRDGSERLYLYKGREYYYALFWTNYLYNGQPVDWCVRIPKESEIGKVIARHARSTKVSPRKF